MTLRPLAVAFGCIVSCAPAVAGAQGVRVGLEAAHVAIERLDPVYADRIGVQSQLSTRLAYGAALYWRAWSLALQQGHASDRVDFGLLDGTSSRLVRTDTSFELRWRSPRLLYGWWLQPAVGFGRLHLRYSPDHLQFVAGGQSVEVSMPPETRWTRHLAAELLHALPGNTALAIRAAWRSYSLDLATPQGSERRDVTDFQAGVAMRLRSF